MIREKQLDGDQKAIQQIQFVGQLENVDGINAAATQSVFVLAILENIKEAILKVFQGSLTVL